MIFYSKGNFVSKGSREGKNGKTYYSIAVIQGTEPFNLGCSPAVYDALESYSVMDEIVFRFTENVMNGRNGAFISRYCVGLGEE